MPNDLDPERFTLRQAAQARDDFAQVMDELDFVKELIAGMTKVALLSRTHRGMSRSATAIA